MNSLINNPQLIVLASISLAISVLYIAYYLLKVWLTKRRFADNKGSLIQVIPPKYQPEDFENIQGFRFALQRFIDNLTATLRNERISLEISASQDGIGFFIWCPNEEVKNLIKMNLNSTYAGRVKIIDIKEDHAFAIDPKSAVQNDYKSAKHDVYMLMDLKDFESVDPVQDIIEAMIGLEDGERVILQVVIQPTKIDKEAIRKAKENFRLGKSEINWLNLFLNRFEPYIVFLIPLLPFLVFKVLSSMLSLFSTKQNVSDPMLLLADSDPRKVVVEKEELTDFNNRLAEKYKTSFTSYIRVVAGGKKMNQRIRGMEQALESMKSETQNRLVKTNRKSFSDFQNRVLYPEDKNFPVFKELFTSQTTLSSREISMLFHLPNNIIDTSINHYIVPEIACGKKYRNKQSPSDLLLGINVARERRVQSYMPEDYRKRHLVVTGQTGTGKSTILKNFILQDLDSRLMKGNKRGFMLLDPHEDFFLEILERIPNGFQDSKNIIAWDTRDEEKYFGFNPLFAVGLSEREIDLVVDSNFKLVEKTLKRMSVDAGMGTTGKPMLLNAMKTLMIFQNEWLKANSNTKENLEFITNNAPTLVDIKSLFTSDEECGNILKFIPIERYEGLRSFWQETLPSYKESRVWPEIRQGFDNRISQITTGILLYTFGQSRSSINIQQIIKDSKILLVNLSSKNIGEEGMSLLGSLLMAKVWFEAKRIEKETRNPFVVYADEFQNFATSDFSQALSEARKFKLELILAHQFFNQLPEDVFHAVLGNVKSKIYYRAGIEDAPIIAKELQNLVLEQEVMEIPEFNAYAKLGEDVFSLYVGKEREATLSPDQVESIISRNYECMGKAKTTIEDEIISRKNWIRDGCKPVKVDLPVIEDGQ